MALRSVNTGNTKKATGLKVGETLKGWVIRFEESSQSKETRKDDPSAAPVSNILMVGEDGEQFLFFTAGNIKYLINDGKIAEGLYTEITRVEDRLVGKKMKKMSSYFDVQQDDERPLTSAPTAKTTVSPVIAQASVDRANIKARAEAMNLGRTGTAKQ